MTYRVVVAGSLASEVEIPDCSRPPKVGQRCTVLLGENTIDFGLILQVEIVKEAPSRMAVEVPRAHDSNAGK